MELRFSGLTPGLPVFLPNLANAGRAGRLPDAPFRAILDQPYVWCYQGANRGV
jgi:hypothetical protein